MEADSILKVLVVERDPAFLQLINIFLASSGFTAKSVSTADEARELMENDPGKFSLVITNVVMPESDGWTMAQQMMTWNPNLKVILTSGESHAELVRQRQLEIPKDIFLRKPFGRQVLSETIARVMSEK